MNTFRKEFIITAFELHDIYGNVYYTPFTLQYVDEDGEVWVDGEFY